MKQSKLLEQVHQKQALQLEWHISLDDVIGKVCEEVMEVIEAVNIWDQEELDGEVRDSIANILCSSEKVGVDITTLTNERINPSLVDTCILLGDWHQKVQGLRGRYIRHKFDQQDLQQATENLIKSILWYDSSAQTLESIMKSSIQKLSSGIHLYKPNINIKDFIVEYPDFPKPWILFRDISPLLQNLEAFRYVCFELAKNCTNADKIVGFDARGFLFGIEVAQILSKPFVMLRKKWKLPGEVENISYGLEYGKDSIELQKWSIQKGEKIALIDDLLATGGTALAWAKLVEGLWWEIDSVNFVISLDEEFLINQEARQALKKYPLYRVVSYKQ